MLGASSPGARLFERDGVTAAIVPACPQRSICNSVTYTDAAALLAGALDELAGALRATPGSRPGRCGCPSSTARRSTRSRRAGHALRRRRRWRCRSSSTAASRRSSATSTGTRDADRGRPRPAQRPRLRPRRPTTASAAALGDAAGRRARSTRPASTASSPACSATIDHDATTSASTSSPPTPSTAGAGLASRLMAVALVEARERGLRTSSLQGSPMGRAGLRPARLRRPTSRCDMYERRRRDERYSDDELEAAIEALSEPERFDEAEALVARAAPQLQRDPRPGARGGRLVRRVARGRAAQGARAATTRRSARRALRILLAEETRMGMMVGVAVGWALAEELNDRRS